MVKKANRKWRMHIDFTNLNRACPKDNYPLSRINTLVDSTMRHQLLSFMDAFSGYNQIKLNKVDQEKTSFVTSQGLFCYKVMPFGLKNAGATYQRLMNRMFAHQIGRNVQVYVDDMLVKSIRENNHLSDLQETFDTLQLYNTKLNPNKCMFGVTARKFLGFMVSQRGIEVNLDKIRAILEKTPPTNIKKVQSLNDKVVRGGEQGLYSLSRVFWHSSRAPMTTVAHAKGYIWKGAGCYNKLQKKNTASLLRHCLL